jgi:DNA polymerase III delta prime subunit
METQSDVTELTKRFINQTNRSIFLTGKAGTGKTTLLKEIIRTTHKKAVIVAPTGIAALNAGGVTIHSFFQLPFSGFIPQFNVPPTVSEQLKLETKDTLVKHFKFTGKRKAILQSVELLIIDEVSMLRADLLDAIDWTLRSIRKENLPFGGVQVLYIGDLLQLPPVIKNEEWNVLRNYYNGIFFFHANVVQEDPPLYIELKKVHRQSDADFIKILNHLRNNQITNEDISILNKYVNPTFSSKDNQGYVTLTTHNFKADSINQEALKELNGKSWFFEAEITGEFPPHMHPIDVKTELKVGAQVMFIKNDLSFEKNYYNGKTGVIHSLSTEEIFVHFPEEDKIIEVERYEWQNIRYSLDDKTQEIKEEVLGTFVHYPIKLAWAITVHKSQGLTFDKAILDVSQVFAPGQAYVALSRLRSLDGLVLLNPIQLNGLENDKQVMSYTTQQPDESKLNNYLSEDTIHYIHKLLTHSYDFRDLATAWRIHDASYVLLGSKSDKGKQRAWSNQQYAVIQTLVQPAEKFIQQLHKLCSQRPVNLPFLLERIEAANHYFIKPLENCAYSTLKKMEEMKRIRKIKAYIEELEELDEIHFKLLMGLKRCSLVVKRLINNEEITKESTWTPEILGYKQDILERIKSTLRQAQGDLLVEVEEELPQLAIKKKDKKQDKEKTKKSTYEITLELFREGKNISAIASERVMSEGTIYSHFTRLIQSGEIEISEVMEKEKLKALENIFEDYHEQSLTPLKEQVGDAFTWEELKLYRASLQNN